MDVLGIAHAKDEEEFTTFEDVLALALANTKSTRFIADSKSWHKVLFKICEKYRDQIPQLEAIFFKERPPLPPQSSQFYQLINTLSISGMISLPNPDYAYIIMDEDQKKRTRDLETKRLDKYKKQIQDISAAFDEYLTAKG